jgi:iron complex transport system ATP-binding protein
MIRFDRFGHDYGNGLVLDGVDITIEPGCISTVCGPNAAGKTTLLRSAAALIEPTRGRVLLDDRPIGSIPVGQRARRLAFMSQRFECASGFSVRRVLELARVMVGRDQAGLDRVVKALELGPLLERGIGELSVGQCQRVALGRALAQCPPDGLLVLDEPLAALDPRWALRTCELLRRRAEAGATILLSVHELSTAARLADRVLLVAQGQLLAHGAAWDVLQPAALEAAYGIPFELLEAADGTMVPIAAPAARM